MASSSGAGGPLVAALADAGATGPRSQAAALKVLAGAPPRALAALAKHADAVARVAAWVARAAGDRTGGPAAADGARALGALPLPPGDRAATGVERAVRKVAETGPDAAARGAGEATLDAWFGPTRAVAAPTPTAPPPATTASRPPAPHEIVVEDTEVDAGLRERLAAARAAAAQAAAAAGDVATAAASRPDPAATLEAFAAFQAARAKAAAREAGLARRHERAARALAEADDGDAATTTPASLQAAVREVVSSTLKPLFKRGKLTREQYDEAGRSAVSKIVEGLPADTELPLSEGKRTKMAALALKVAARVRGK